MRQEIVSSLRWLRQTRDRGLLYVYGLTVGFVRILRAGMNGACQKPKLKESAVAISGYVNVTASSEADLLRAAAAQPVSVAVDAGSFVWQLYGGGVFTGPCTTELNHGVTVVGYGETQGDADGDGAGTPGQKYWIVKNSWGAEWGEDGYIRMQRQAGAADGLCGIALLPSYPLM